MNRALIQTTDREIGQNIFILRPPLTLLFDGAELSLGDGVGKIYIVEPTGPVEDDPNLTDKKFPGNPTMSYCFLRPLRVVGEVTDWKGHSAEQLNAMKEHLERLKQLGIEAIED